MEWRIWYCGANGQSCALSGNTQKAWRNAPRENAVVLKVWRGDRKEIYCGHDAIWWDGEGKVFQIDLPDPFLAVARAEAEAGYLKFGLLVPNEDYERIYEEALAARR